MNKDIIAGKWQEVKGAIKKQWANFTDDDVGKMKGSYEELKGELQKKYGYEKEKAEKELDSFIKEHGFGEKDEE